MWVVKIGGSLATDETLSLWLDALSCYGGGNVVIVPGGGPFADVVMKSQRFWNFSDSSAHCMALMAMDQYGEMMAGIRPDLIPAQYLEDIHKVLNRSGVPIWLPASLLSKNDRVEHSWDVTSDSLAAWLAQQLGAKHLLLVKSTTLENGPVLLEKLISTDVVDAAFARYVRHSTFSVTLISRNQYYFIPKVLNEDASVGTKVMWLQQASREQ